MTTTIFFSTDGRYTVLGSGDAIEASPDLIAEMQRQGYQGWVAILSGSSNWRCRIGLSPWSVTDQTGP